MKTQKYNLRPLPYGGFQLLDDEGSYVACVYRHTADRLVELIDQANAAIELTPRVAELEKKNAELRATPAIGAQATIALNAHAELLGAAKSLVEGMETCHICKGLVLLNESATNCEDCSSDCDDHEEPDCVPIYVLHGKLSAAIVEAESAELRRTPAIGAQSLALEVERLTKVEEHLRAKVARLQDSKEYLKTKIAELEAEIDEKIMRARGWK